MEMEEFWSITQFDDKQIKFEAKTQYGFSSRNII